MIERLQFLRSRFRSALYRAPHSHRSFVDVEKAEMIFYLNYLKDGMTVFDVGANIGLLTLLFSRSIGSGVVYAFEPASDNFARLSEICGIGLLPDVQLNNIALAEAELNFDLH